LLKSGLFGPGLQHWGESKLLAPSVSVVFALGVLGLPLSTVAIIGFIRNLCCTRSVDEPVEL
jgi:hypothetical protein